MRPAMRPLADPSDRSDRSDPSDPASCEAPAPQRHAKARQGSLLHEPLAGARGPEGWDAEASKTRRRTAERCDENVVERKKSKSLLGSCLENHTEPDVAAPQPGFRFAAEGGSKKPGILAVVGPAPQHTLLAVGRALRVGLRAAEVTRRPGDEYEAPLGRGEASPNCAPEGPQKPRASRSAAWRSAAVGAPLVGAPTGAGTSPAPTPRVARSARSFSASAQSRSFKSAHNSQVPIANWQSEIGNHRGFCSS